MQSGNTRSQPAETMLAAAAAQLATDPAAALAVAEDLLARAPDLLPAQLLAASKSWKSMHLPWVLWQLIIWALLPPVWRQ